MKEYNSISEEMDSYPLTAGQVGVYYACIKETENLMYNLPFACALPLSIDSKKLCDAIKRVVRNYSAFQVCFKVIDGEARMVRRTPFIDIKTSLAKEKDMAELKKSFIKPFDLEAGELSRFIIVLTEKSLWLLADFHHIILDGSSVNIFFDAVSKVYAGKELEKEEISLLQVACMEQKEAKTATYKKAHEFYEQKLSENDFEDSIAPDFWENKNKSFGPANAIESYFDEEINATNVEAFVRKNGITEATFFTGAFAFALSKITGSDGCLFCTVNHGRHTSSFKQTIGMLVRTSPLCVSMDENLLSKEYLAFFYKLFRETIANDTYPFSKLATEFGITNDTMFVYQAQTMTHFVLDENTVDLQILNTGYALAKLSVQIFKVKEHYKISIGYRSDLYLEEKIQSFLSLMKLAVNGFLQEIKLKDISLVTDSQMEILESFHGEKIHYKERAMVELLRDGMHKNPEHIAVVSGNRKITYRELDEITNRLAAYLVTKGIGKEDVVAILSDRNEMMVICPLAVIKAGAMYQPLDNTYPSERLTFMVKDSGAKLLLSTRELRHLVETDIETFYTEELSALPDNNVVLPNPSPDDAFVILYTSGSTGMPKGCILEHRNVVQLVSFYTNWISLTEESKVSAYASFGFDANMLDTIPTLCAGATLYIIPLAMRLELEKLNGYMEENRITHAFFTTQVGRQFALEFCNNSLKYLSTGGEALVPCEPPKNCAFVNLYGPTEATVFVTGFIIDKLYHSVPIGKANAGVNVYIVDKYFRRVPFGVPGELCVAGGQVARGYFNRPEKTAEAFIDNPFTEEAEYKKMYRTGDVVCFLPDGNIQFVGRKDSQVKVRGFRIELTEVEEVIRRFEGITDATVVAFDDKTGGKYIVAYVVANHEIDIEELNSFIRSEKPSYMVPAVTMQIDKIPLNQNQKVNRKALPKPEHKTKHNIEPKNETQQKIYDYIAEILGYKEFGISTNLFDAGLTSISLVKLLSKLSKEFNKSFSIKDLQENDTIEKLEKLLDSKMEEEVFEFLEEYPITKTQEGIFFECLSKPDSTVYNIVQLIKLNDKVDIEKLKRAIVETVNAHPYLLTTFFMTKDGVFCKRNKDVHFEISDIEEISVNSAKHLGETICKPFVLQGERLFRIAIIHSTDITDGIRLYLDFHHIIFDGTSFEIFMQEVSRAYNGEILEEESYSCYEVALTEQNLRKTVAYQKAKDYYHNLLADMEGTSLPLGDWPDKEGFISETFEINKLSLTEVKRFCSNNHVTENVLFTAAFGYLLARYQNDEQSIFTTVYNGRNDSRLSNSIAMYVKTYPVLCKVTNTKTTEYVKKIGKQLDLSRLQDLYSFAEINQDLGIYADIMFVFQDNGFEVDTFCGQSYTTEKVVIDAKKATIAIIVTMKADKVIVEVEYDTSQYSHEYMNSFITTYEQVLCGMLSECDLDDISLVDEAMRERLESFHGEKTHDKECSVIDLLRDGMKKNPEHIAVVCGNTKITYREFDEITDRLASYLVKKGIGKEDVVAILSDRNESMAICPVAVIKAGAMYQPLDNTYPSERLTFMVKDSGAKLLLSSRELRHLVETDIETFYTEDISTLTTNYVVLPNPSPDDAFVILYTSGSTGLPKGCVLEHKNFAHYLRFFADRFKIDDNANIAAYASFGFDASVMDLFSSLFTGATLFIIPLDMRLELYRLNEYFEKNRITHVFMTTQVGRQFITTMNSHSIQYLIMGGEALTPLKPPKNYTIVNGYGPTETTCGISFFDIDRLYHSVPLGKINRGQKAYIVDKRFRRVPVGVPGELCIAGRQVARGYLNRPEKTAEVFVDNPFTDETEYKKMYRTGDIVCFLPNGNLQFVGRKDSQVKIRGFRIELTEVEEVIRRFEGIIDAAVVAFDDKMGGKFIAAYVVSDKQVDVNKLNAFIEKEKPSYMVPAVTMQIEEIPLTQNQKVNKRALPKPEKTSRDYVAPKNKIEKDFCEIMGEALGMQPYSATDNFFEVGGSSILATKVLASALSKDYKVSYADLFKYSSPQRIAQYLGVETYEENCANTDNRIRDYSYDAINELIQKANMELVDAAIEGDLSVLKGNMGNILLTGATGFLGIHVLKEYLTSYKGKVYCLVRKTKKLSAKQRLKTLLVYYFSDDFEEAFEDGRINILEAGITDANLEEALKDVSFDTIIHCAACVKHFVTNDILYRINTLGTKNLLDICEKNKKRFVHMSTASVCGIKQEGITKDVFTETDLFIGQSTDNEYVQTKFLAERFVLEAALRGADVKIVRLGNLMSRISDGEFQINFITNGFMRDIRGIAALGHAPVERANNQADFSPIDSTAEAVLKIADSNLPVHIYHAYNNHFIYLGEIINILVESGFSIKDVSEKEYRKQIKIALQKYKGDAVMSDRIGGLLAYKDAKTGTELEVIGTNNDFTTKILMRLGFRWPKVEKDYVKKSIENLINMGFFDEKRS